jgi:hypothetical protein
VNLLGRNARLIFTRSKYWAFSARQGYPPGGLILEPKPKEQSPGDLPGVICQTLIKSKMITENTPSGSKTIHISASIDGLLKLKDSRLKALFQMPGREARLELLNRKAAGDKLIKSDKCDNFDPVKGCLGHVIEEPKTLKANESKSI